MEKFTEYDIGVVFPIDTQLFLVRTIDDENGLRFEFRDSKIGMALSLTFDSYSMYRVSNESYRHRVWDQISTASFVVASNDSDFIQWFHCESSNLYIDSNIKHYLILSADDYIDVLSFDAPLVTI